MNKLAKLGKAGALIAILLVLAIFLPQIAHFFTDYLWFGELGYQAVFLKFTFAKFAVGFVVFLLVFLLAYWHPAGDNQIPAGGDRGKGYGCQCSR